MKKIKNALQWSLDFIEIYFPSIMFSALFIAFIIQIVSRYLFNNPLVWPYEVAQLSYLWVILLGTCYAARDDSNIVFSVVYELVPHFVQKAFDILKSILIIGLLTIMIPSTIKFYEFYFTRYSTVLKIPLGLVYFPFSIYMVITICSCIKDIVLCIRNFKGNKGQNNEEEKRT
ncbi:putative transporter [Oscillibacter valericigenes Sjm18-20]|nr:putative transporter [Oscillibacter valericigenes Sjm18-20]